MGATSSSGRPSRNPQARRPRNERESFNSSGRQGGKDRVDRDGTWNAGAARHDRSDARGASFRFGQHEDEGRCESLRRETMAAKRNGPSASRIQIVRDLAGRWRGLRAKAARLHEKSFQDNQASRLSEGTERTDQGGRRVDRREIRRGGDQDEIIYRPRKEADRCAESPDRFRLVR